MNDLIVNSDIRTLTEIKKHYCELFSNQINLSQFLYFSIYTLCWQLQLIIRQKESRNSPLRQPNHEIITNSSSLHCHALTFRSASVCVYISSSIIHTYIKSLWFFFHHSCVFKLIFRCEHGCSSGGEIELWNQCTNVLSWPMPCSGTWLLVLWTFASLLVRKYRPKLLQRTVSTTSIINTCFLTHVS